MYSLENNEVNMHMLTTQLYKSLTFLVHFSPRLPTEVLTVLTFATTIPLLFFSFTSLYLLNTIFSLGL